MFKGFLKTSEIVNSKKFGANHSENPINIEKTWCKMIVKGKYTYQYSTVNLKVSVAKRFRKFSKKTSKTHSETLHIIMDFFEWHGFLPSDRFEKSLLQEIVKNRKRTEATIAIIKAIEKNQTKPTTAMLQSLFEKKLEQQEPKLIERKFANKPSKEKPAQSTAVPKVRYKRLEDKMTDLKEDFSYVLTNIKTVKGSFGKTYYKLELTSDEIEKYKRIINNS